jgi:hypothetical protein
MLWRSCAVRPLSVPALPRNSHFSAGRHWSRVLLLRIGAALVFACSVSVTLAGVAAMVLP